jgi:hypothetical protein
MHQTKKTKGILLSMDKASLKVFLYEVSIVNVMSPGLGGMNARNNSAVPGGSSATDIVNNLRKSTFELAQLFQQNSSLELVQRKQEEIRGQIQTLVVLDQISTRRADELFDKLDAVLE